MSISVYMEHHTGHDALHRLRAQICVGQVLLGLDSGRKRWGVAISDDALTTSLPLLQYDRQKYAQDMAFLGGLVAERDVGGVVIGLPLYLDGGFGARGQAAEQLGKDIADRLHLPVAFWDERFSSVVMEREMITRGDVSRRKRQQSLDKLAAAYILQGALDSLAYPVSRNPDPDG